MRKEVANWWQQALKDLETAQKNLQIGEYHLVAFLCHQATEKALKALYIHKLKESPGATHSLLFLGKKVSIPEQLLSLLRKMAPDFILSRYPNAAHGLPYELYDEDIAKERLEAAREALNWVEKQF